MTSHFAAKSTNFNVLVQDVNLIKSTISTVHNNIAVTGILIRQSSLD